MVAALGRYVPLFLTFVLINFFSSGKVSGPSSHPPLPTPPSPGVIWHNFPLVMMVRKCVGRGRGRAFFKLMISYKLKWSTLRLLTAGLWDVGNLRGFYGSINKWFWDGSSCFTFYSNVFDFLMEAIKLLAKINFLLKIKKMNKDFFILITLSIISWKWS